MHNHACASLFSVVISSRDLMVAVANLTPHLAIWPFMYGTRVLDLTHHTQCMSTYMYTYMLSNMITQCMAVCLANYTISHSSIMTYQ